MSVITGEVAFAGPAARETIGRRLSTFLYRRAGLLTLLLLAPALGEKPRGVAERLAGELDERLGPDLDRVEVAGPGFLNLFLSERWYREAAARLLAAGEDLGKPAEPATGR